MIAIEGHTAGAFVNLAAGASNSEILDLALMHCWARGFDGDEIMHMINVHANNGKGQNAYDIPWNNKPVRGCLKKHGGQATPKHGDGAPGALRRARVGRVGTSIRRGSVIVGSNSGGPMPLLRPLASY